MWRTHKLNVMALLTHSVSYLCLHSDSFQKAPFSSLELNTHLSYSCTRVGDNLRSGWPAVLCFVWSTRSSTMVCFCFFPILCLVHYLYLQVYFIAGFQRLLTFICITKIEFPWLYCYSYCCFHYCLLQKPKALRSQRITANKRHIRSLPLWTLS